MDLNKATITILVCGDVHLPFITKGEIDSTDFLSLFANESFANPLFLTFSATGIVELSTSSTSEVPKGTGLWSAVVCGPTPSIENLMAAGTALMVEKIPDKLSHLVEDVHLVESGRLIYRSMTQGRVE